MTIYSSTQQSLATSCDKTNLVYSELIPCPNNSGMQWIQLLQNGDASALNEQLQVAIA